MANNPKRISILGSTGSIGTQTLEVVRDHPEKLQVVAISAGNNAELLVKQAKEFKPKVVVIANEDKYNEVRNALAREIQVMAGEEGLIYAASLEEAEMVVTAMVGYSGLIPTIEAINAGKDIALANKETLVVAGELISQLAQEKGISILQVSSQKVKLHLRLFFVNLLLVIFNVFLLGI